MEPSQIAKWLAYIGLGLLIAGGLFWLAGKFGFAFGKLPGDLHVQKEKYSIYFPIVTSIIISIALTILINLILWLFRK